MLGHLALWLMAATSRDAAAHHSFAMYDTAKVVTLTGTIKEFQWTNPHALIWLVNDTAPGTPPDLWSIELPTSPGPLSRMGWNKRSLAPGDRVVVEINPLREGKHGGSFKKAKLERTGETLVATAKDEPDSGAPATDNYGSTAPAGGDAAPPAEGPASAPQPAGKRTGCSVGLATLHEGGMHGGFLGWSVLLGWVARLQRRRALARRR